MIRARPSAQLSSLGRVTSYWIVGGVATGVGLGALTPMLASWANPGARPSVIAATMVIRICASFMNGPEEHTKCQFHETQDPRNERGLAPSGNCWSPGGWLNLEQHVTRWQVIVARPRHDTRRKRLSGRYTTRSKIATA